MLPMTALNIEYIDDEDFLELERCLESAERKQSSLQIAQNDDMPQAFQGSSAAQSKRPAAHSPASLQQHAQLHVSIKKTACKAASELFPGAHVQHVASAATNGDAICGGKQSAANSSLPLQDGTLKHQRNLAASAGSATFWQCTGVSRSGNLQGQMEQQQAPKPQLHVCQLQHDQEQPYDHHRNDKGASTTANACMTNKELHHTTLAGQSLSMQILQQPRNCWQSYVQQQPNQQQQQPVWQQLQPPQHHQQQQLQQQGAVQPQQPERHHLQQRSGCNTMQRIAQLPQQPQEQQLAHPSTTIQAPSHTHGAIPEGLGRALSAPVHSTLQQPSNTAGSKSWAAAPGSSSGYGLAAPAAAPQSSSGGAGRVIGHGRHHDQMQRHLMSNSWPAGDMAQQHGSSNAAPSQPGVQQQQQQWHTAGKQSESRSHTGGHAVCILQQQQQQQGLGGPAAAASVNGTIAMPRKQLCPISIVGACLPHQQSTNQHHQHLPHQQQCGTMQRHHEAVEPACGASSHSRLSGNGACELQQAQVHGAPIVDANATNTAIAQMTGQQGFARSTAATTQPKQQQQQQAVAKPAGGNSSNSQLAGGSASAGQQQPGSAVQQQSGADVAQNTAYAMGTSAAAPEGSSLSGRRKLPPSLQASCKGPFSSKSQHQRPAGPAPQQQEQQEIVPHGKPQQQLGFQGTVRYSYNPVEVDWLCRQMLDSGPPKVIGLDIEWRPAFKTGQAPNRTALLQIAYAADKEGRDWRPKLHGKGVMVLLLHIYYTGITPALQEILQRDDIVKVGVNIGGDVSKLLADFKVEVCGTDDLSDAAHGRQLRCVEGITANIECKRWSLAGLVEEVLGLQLPKPNQIRLGNWERRPLSDEQKQYATLDAFASLLLHWELQALPERLTLSQQLRTAMMERAEAAIAATEEDPLRC